jgi:hypothetical protein
MKRVTWRHTIAIALTLELNAATVGASETPLQALMAINNKLSAALEQNEPHGAPNTHA